MELSTSGKTKEFVPVHEESMDNNHAEEQSPNQTCSDVTLDVVSVKWYQREPIRTIYYPLCMLKAQSKHNNHVSTVVKYKPDAER